MLCASYINMLVMRIVLLKLKLIKEFRSQIHLLPKCHEIPKLCVREPITPHMKVSVRFQSE